MNLLEQSQGDLPGVNYENLLKIILENIQQKNPFDVKHKLQDRADRLIVKLDNTALNISQLQIFDPIFSNQRARSITLNLVEECQAKFPELITAVRNAISQHLTSTLQEESFSLDRFIEPLNRENSSNLGLRFNFPQASSVSGASQFCKNISFGWQNSRSAFPV
ncbi:hypothetical protein POG22_02050 [Geitlerinema sp. CS-897]|nr:hypothetical protein [Geitlerinema sp. CS-897]